MKIKEECVSCLIKRIAFEVRLSTKNEKLQNEITQNVCNFLSKEYNPSICSADLATKAHKIVYTKLNNNDPYSKLKTKSNNMAKAFVPQIEKLINESKYQLKTAMICSIVGNMLDFGIKGSAQNPDELKKIFKDIYEERLGYDDYCKLEKIIKNASNLVLFTDNCGEIVFDKILCKELKKFNNKLKIFLVVKGKPVLSDATKQDASYLDFDEVVDEILTTGCFAVGVNFKLLPPNVRKYLTKTDIILCKGMANYESFSEKNYSPIAYLLRTKCRPIANSLKVPVNSNIIKVFD